MKSGERREAIIAAAVRLFSEQGFRGATTRELAAALEVTEPVIYQHFETKRDLYRAIIESKARERRTDNEHWQEMENPRSDRGFFVAVAKLLLERVERDPSYLRLLLFSALERHELADLFFERDAAEIYDRFPPVISASGQRRAHSGPTSIRELRRARWWGWPCITPPCKHCSRTRW